MDLVSRADVREKILEKWLFLFRETALHHNLVFVVVTFLSQSKGKKKSPSETGENWRSLAGCEGDAGFQV